MKTELPNPTPRPAEELEQLEAAWRPPRGWRIASSVNNTHVGLFYIATAFGFFLLAGVLALVMRAQLALPGATLIEPRLYNQVFTMHGTVMMFLFAVPVVEAVAVWLLPNMLGARDLPFPRLSAYAFWAYAFGGACFFLTIFFDAAPDQGWFMYPPLSGAQHSPGIGADFWLLGIGFIEISAIAGAVELIVGIAMTRTPGMSFAKLPVYAWAMLVVGVMIVLAFPAIIAGTALLELERAFDWPIFDPQRGGDPLIWQHLFWFFGHPEVYIIFLPAAGLMSMLVPVLARTPLMGETAVNWALIAVGTLSFALWIHHMFTAGLSPWAMAFVSAASLAIALPGAVQVFAWIGTLARGRRRLLWSTSTWFVLGFLALFVLGGLTGLMTAVVPFDRQVHDTHFVVAHLHYVLIGGLVFPLFAALYHWLPLVGGHGLSERSGRWVAGLMFIGFNLAFFPMHASGLMGMPRRVATYASDPGWFGLDAMNLVSSIGAFVFAAGVALCAADLLRTLRKPKVEAGDPWGAATLEWLPDDHYGARSMPAVTSRRPLWDQPQLVHEVPAGAHWLPGNPTGRREALVTTFVDAKPRYLLVLPGDGWMPLIAAAGTAAFFLLLTVKWIVTAWICGFVAIGATWIWLWGLDRPAQPEHAVIGHERGREVRVPVGGDGRFDHAIAGFLIVLVVDASVFLSLLYSHLHVAMASAVCPPPGAALPDVSAAVAGPLAWVAAAIVIEIACRWFDRFGSFDRPGVGPPPRKPLRGTLALVALLAAAAFAAALFAQAGAGLEPRRDAWSATLAALVAYDGLHAIAAVLFAAFAIARSSAALLVPRHRAVLDALRWLVHASALQAFVVAIVTRGLPSWLA